MADFIDKIWGAKDGSTVGGLPGTSRHWEPTAGIEAHESESPWVHDHQDRLVDTRRTLHGVAELLLAGPQHRASETIRLAVTPTGFRTVARPEIRLDHTDLIVGHQRVPLHGTFTHVAESVGLTAAGPFDVYAEGPDADPRRHIEIDEAARHEIVDALNRGDSALRAFAPDQTPVLWPEHFDVSVVVDEITYGVSPGDDDIAVPYAYVAPFVKRSGPFWNKAFGAARPLAELPGDDTLIAFFAEGRAAAGD